MVMRYSVGSQKEFSIFGSSHTLRTRVSNIDLVKPIFTLNFTKPTLSFSYLQNPGQNRPLRSSPNHKQKSILLCREKNLPTDWAATNITIIKLISLIIRLKDCVTASASRRYIEDKPGGGKKSLRSHISNTDFSTIINENILFPLNLCLFRLRPTIIGSL